MKIIDAHVHLDRMAGEDILRMAWGGVEAVIVPTPHLMSGLFTARTVLDLWDKTLGYIVEYGASMGIDCYATIGVRHRIGALGKPKEHFQFADPRLTCSASRGQTYRTGSKEDVPFS